MSEKLNAQTAPGTLELVRQLLNTWHIPNDTRSPADDLATPEDIQNFLVAHLPSLAMAPDASQIQKLRDDLRACVKTREIGPINRWLERIPFNAIVTEREQGSVDIDWRSDREGSSACAAVLHIVLDAIRNNQWPRLKACPDCQWIHYDNTRNGAKVWCGMTKGTPDGRACGTIAKVNRWREKQRNMSAGEALD